MRPREWGRLRGAAAGVTTRSTLFFYAASGLLVGAALTSSACFCTQPSAPDGEYVRGRYQYKLSPATVEAERDYRIEMDDGHLTESYAKNGKKYVIRYKLGRTQEFGHR